jgi:N-acetylglutamate synthase-like GNAT family acetyltransferase
MPLSPLAIRPAQGSDVAAIERLIKAAILRLAARQYGQARAELWAQRQPLDTRALISANTCLVGEREEQIVAIAGWAPHEKWPERAWLRGVFVDPNLARRGAGRQIVIATEAAAQEAGRVEFGVMASLNSVPFFAALGYRELRRQGYAPAPGLMLEGALMAKSTLKTPNPKG